MLSIETLDPQRTALVIVDLQRGYCDPTSDCATKLKWDVQHAEDICRRHLPFLARLRTILPSSHIIWFQMEEHPATFAPNLHCGGTAIPLDETLCVRGTPGHDFHLVAPEKGEAVFQKFHYNGFHCAAFRDYLDQHGFTQLVFTGVVGSRCVYSTLMSASERGYSCFVLPDLIGGPGALRQEIETYMNVATQFYARSLASEEFLALMDARRTQASASI